MPRKWSRPRSSSGLSAVAVVLEHDRGKASTTRSGARKSCRPSTRSCRVRARRGRVRSSARRADACVVGGPCGFARSSSGCAPPGGRAEASGRGQRPHSPQTCPQAQRPARRTSPARLRGRCAVDPSTSSRTSKNGRGGECLSNAVGTRARLTSHGRRPTSVRQSNSRQRGAHAPLRRRPFRTGAPDQLAAASSASFRRPSSARVRRLLREDHASQGEQCTTTAAAAATAPSRNRKLRAPTARHTRSPVRRASAWPGLPAAGCKYPLAWTTTRIAFCSWNLCRPTGGDCAASRASARIVGAGQRRAKCLRNGQLFEGLTGALPTSLP